MFVFDSLLVTAYHLVTSLADALSPMAGTLSTAAAIVACTVVLRTLLLPLAAWQARSVRAQERLMPKVQAIRERYRDPHRRNQEIVKLFADENVTPTPGCLPMVAQWPFVMTLFRLFLLERVAGQVNVLLTATLLGAPLGENLAAVIGVYGLFTVPVAVYVGVLALIALVAWASSRRAARLATAAAGPLRTMARVLPYGALVAAVFLPLAAGLYLLTTTAWTLAEQAVLRRGALVSST